MSDEACIAHLRSLEPRALLELRQRAAIAVGWEGFDDEGCTIDPDDYECDGCPFCDGEPDATICDGDEREWSEYCDTLQLRTLADSTAANVSSNGHWVVYPPGEGMPVKGKAADNFEGVKECERVAITMGWRLPWKP